MRESSSCESVFGAYNLSPREYRIDPAIILPTQRGHKDRHGSPFRSSVFLLVNCNVQQEARVFLQDLWPL